VGSLPRSINSKSIDALGAAQITPQQADSIIRAFSVSKQIRFLTIVQTQASVGRKQQIRPI
jgi:hypothetical protein